MEEFDSGHDETFGLDESQLALLGTTDGSDDEIDRYAADMSGSDEQNEYEEANNQEQEIKPEPVEKSVDQVKEPEQEKSEDHKVPVSVLQKEREERKQWRDRANQLEGQLRMIAQSLQGQNSNGHQVEQNNSADPNVDPIGYLQQSIQSIQRKAEAFEEFQRQQILEKQQYEVENQIKDEWQKSVSVAKQEIPDIEDATRFLVERRADQLRLAGLDGNQVSSTLQNEFMYLVRTGYEKYGNPAKFAHELARTYGYQPKVSLPSHKEQIQRAEEAKRKTRTIASIPGTPASDDISLEVLDQMSESQFNNWVSKNPKKYERLIMKSMQ